MPRGGKQDPVLCATDLLLEHERRQQAAALLHSQIVEDAAELIVQRVSDERKFSLTDLRGKMLA